MTDDERRAVHAFRQLIDIVADTQECLDDIQISAWLGAISAIATHGIKVIHEAEMVKATAPKLLQ